MPTIELPDGLHEFRCTSYTTSIYEQAFRDDPYPKVTGDISADVFGKRRVGEDALGIVWSDDGETIEALVFDYESDNWQAEKRALWAMLRTQQMIDAKHGKDTKPVPYYTAWDEELCLEWEPDMREVAHLVTDELYRGLFRSGAAASEETSEEGE